MSRIVNRPISATVSSDTGKPIEFVDRDYTHHIVHIIDWWCESGRWWENQPDRTVYRVLTVDDYMYDIECVGDAWFMYRVWD